MEIVDTKFILHQVVMESLSYSVRVPPTGFRNRINYNKTKNYNNKRY